MYFGGNFLGKKPKTLGLKTPTCPEGFSFGSSQKSKLEYVDNWPTVNEGFGGAPNV